MTCFVAIGFYNGDKFTIGEYSGNFAILTPTTPGSAFAMGEKSDDPVAMYLNDVLTVR